MSSCSIIGILREHSTATDLSVGVPASMRRVRAMATAEVPKFRPRGVQKPGRRIRRVVRRLDLAAGVAEKPSRGHVVVGVRRHRRQGAVIDREPGSRCSKRRRRRGQPAGSRAEPTARRHCAVQSLGLRGASTLTGLQLPFGRDSPSGVPRRRRMRRPLLLMPLRRHATPGTAGRAGLRRRRRVRWTSG